MKVNLTTPKLTFPGIEEYAPYTIVDEPQMGLIYLNSKDEKRVMYLEEIVKFCDAILEKVLNELSKVDQESISAALFAKRKEEQVPIYFISRVLQGAEINYPGLEKLILAQTLTKPKKLGRVAKWAIKLGEHDIAFQKRGDETPKDFLIKVSPEDNRKETKGRPDTKSKKTKLSCKWKLYTDGAASFDGSGAGLMLIDLEGKEYTYALRFGFKTTNNEAEYKALLAGLRITQDMEITSLAIFIDS
ncbi:reverse transcriptase domain-containing protein, partial [Tanacetum coccineum]